MLVYIGFHLTLLVYFAFYNLNNMPRVRRGVCSSRGEDAQPEFICRETYSTPSRWAVDIGGGPKASGE